MWLLHIVFFQLTSADGKLPCYMSHGLFTGATSVGQLPSRLSPY